MARQTKSGIDYFSHDTDMFHDQKIRFIKAKHGMIGYAVFIRLLEEIYRDKGYYIEVNEDYNILFADENNIELNDYILILNDYINKELFDSELYNEYGILTSKRIQNNYIDATLRRKNVEIIKEYLLLEIEDVHIKNKDVNILDLNADISTQSKVNKSRVDKSKEEKDIPPTKKTYEDFVKLTEEEHQKLKDKLGTQLTKDFILRLNNYIGSKGKKYKSHYHTILTWYNKDQKENTVNSVKKPDNPERERNMV